MGALQEEAQEEEAQEEEASDSKEWGRSIRVPPLRALVKLFSLHSNANSPDLVHYS